MIIIQIAYLLKPPPPPSIHDCIQEPNATSIMVTINTCTFNWCILIDIYYYTYMQPAALYISSGLYIQLNIIYYYMYLQ